MLGQVDTHCADSPRILGLLLQWLQRNHGWQFMQFLDQYLKKGRENSSNITIYFIFV
uniref:Uncharacterized protein n=1 Tax=Manihot esculenta TaxID=3983 RepID=A0A2C9WD65_MANES